MTAQEKTVLSKFLNLALDYSGTGYSRERDYSFEDDPPEVELPEQETTQAANSLVDDKAASSLPSTLPLAYLVDEEETGDSGVNPLVVIIGSNLNEKQAQLFNRILASAGLSLDTNCSFIDEGISDDPSYLKDQIDSIKPRVVLFLGKEKKTHIETENEIPVLTTYHPEQLLQNEALKRPAFEDMKNLMATLAGLDYGYKNEAAHLLKKYAANDADFAERIRELF